MRRTSSRAPTMRTSATATATWARPQLSGHLEKLSRSDGTWRRRFVSLNGAQLLLFRSSPAGRPLSILDLGGARITASRQPVHRHGSSSSGSSSDVDRAREGGAANELLYVLRLALLPQADGGGSSSSGSGRQTRYKLAATSREMQGLWCDALSAAAASAATQPPQRLSMRRPSARPSAAPTGLGAADAPRWPDHQAAGSSSPAVRPSRASAGGRQQQARLLLEPRQSTRQLQQRHRPSAAGCSSEADADDESERHLLRQPRGSQLSTQPLRQRPSVKQQQEQLSTNMPLRHSSRREPPLAAARQSLTAAAAAQSRPRASLAAVPEGSYRSSASRASGVMQQQVVRPSQLAASRSSMHAAASSPRGPDRQQRSSSRGSLAGRQPVYRNTLSSRGGSASDSATGSGGSSTPSASGSYTGSSSRSSSAGRANAGGKHNTWGWGQWCCWLVSTLSTDGGSSSCDSDLTMESWEVRASRRSSTRRICISTVEGASASRRSRSSSDSATVEQQQQQQQHRGSMHLSSQPERHRSASASAAMAPDLGGPWPRPAKGARLPSRSMVDAPQRFTSRSTPGGGIGRMRSSLPASWEAQQARPSQWRSKQQQHNSASTSNVLLELPAVSSSPSLAAWQLQQAQQQQPLQRGQPQRRSASTSVGGLVMPAGQPRHSASAQQSDGGRRVSRVSAQPLEAARASQAGNRQPQVAASSMQDVWWQQEDEQQQQEQQQQSQLEQEPEALWGSASGSQPGAAVPRGRSSSQQQYAPEPRDAAAEVEHWGSGAGAAPSSSGGGRRSMPPQLQPARVSAHARTAQPSAAAQAGEWGSGAGAAAASPSQSLAGGRLAARHSKRGSVETAAWPPQQPAAAATAAEWWAIRRSSADVLDDARSSLLAAEGGSINALQARSSAGSAAPAGGGGLLTGATTSLSAYDDVSRQLRQQAQHAVGADAAAVSSAARRLEQLIHQQQQQQQQPVADLRPDSQAAQPASVMAGRTGGWPAAAASFLDAADAAAHQPSGLVPSPPAVRAQTAGPRPPPPPPALPPTSALHVTRALPPGPPPALPLPSVGGPQGSQQQQSAALASKAAEGLPAALAAAGGGREALLAAIQSGARLQHVHRASMVLAQQAGLLQ